MVGAKRDNERQEVVKNRHRPAIKRMQGVRKGGGGGADYSGE